MAAPGDVLPDCGVVEDEDEADAGLGVGRLRMRSMGWNAAGGGEETLGTVEVDMTSCGMGARLFLWTDAGQAEKRASLRPDAAVSKGDVGLTPRPKAFVGLLRPLPRLLHHPIRLGQNLYCVLHAVAAWT